MWTFSVKIPYVDAGCSEEMNNSMFTFLDTTESKPFGACTTNVFGHHVYFVCAEDDVVIEYSWMDEDACDPDNYLQAPVKLTFKNNQCVYEDIGFSHYTSWEGTCSSSGTSLVDAFFFETRPHFFVECWV